MLFKIAQNSVLHSKLRTSKRYKLLNFGFPCAFNGCKQGEICNYQTMKRISRYRPTIPSCSSV